MPAAVAVRAAERLCGDQQLERPKPRDASRPRVSSCRSSISARRTPTGSGAQHFLPQTIDEKTVLSHV